MGQSWAHTTRQPSGVSAVGPRSATAWCVGVWSQDKVGCRRVHMGCAWGGARSRTHLQPRSGAIWYGTHGLLLIVHKGWQASMLTHLEQWRLDRVWVGPCSSQSWCRICHPRAATQRCRVARARTGTGRLCVGARFLLQVESDALICRHVFVVMRLLICQADAAARFWGCPGLLGNAVKAMQVQGRRRA